jgi:branched-chain amino acid transport system permease protein
MNRLYSFLAVILGILLVLPRVLNNYWLEIFILIFYYAYLGQCWNILTGYSGNISLGHSLYLGIGAYTSTRLAMVLGLTPWVGMFAGALLALVVGLFIGFLGFRFGLRGVYFVLITISFAEIGRLIALHMDSLGSFMGLFIDFKPGFWNMQFRSNVPYYYIALGLLLFSLIVVRIFETSKIGRSLVAIREDEEAAESLGVNTFRYKMGAIALSAFMTALAGTFDANRIFHLNPERVMSMGMSIEIILRPIIGGMGTVLGPVVGSFLITLPAEWIRAYLSEVGRPGLHMVIYGLVLILVVFFFPRGVMPFLRRVFDPMFFSRAPKEKE